MMKTPLMNYKNEKRWKDIGMDELAYIPELAEDSSDEFTKRKLIEEVNGKEDVAERLFDLLEWQFPSTLIDEWQREGEMDEEYNLIPQH